MESSANETKESTLPERKADPTQDTTGESMPIVQTERKTEDKPSVSTISTQGIQGAPVVDKTDALVSKDPSKRRGSGGGSTANIVDEIEDEEVDEELSEESSSSGDEYKEEEMSIPEWFLAGRLVKPKGLMRPGDDIVIECKPMQLDETDEQKKRRKALNKSISEYFKGNRSNRSRFICAHLDLFRPFLIEMTLKKWYDKLNEHLNESTESSGSALSNEKQEEPEAGSVKERETGDSLAEGAKDQPGSVKDAASEVPPNEDTEMSGENNQNLNSEVDTKPLSDLVEKAKLLRAKLEEEKKSREPEKQPAAIVNGTLRDYQLRGLNWMAECERYGASCILGDEMGLGKTLQTITLLAYLKTVKKLDGPSVVVAPLSVLSSWMNEFDRWCPELKAVRFHGPWIERQRIAREMCKPGEFDVVVTTYEMVISAQDFFSNTYFWRYLVIDEGHRLKNEATLLSQALSHIPRTACLLLTGTPLQNNMHELWSLLYFLHPDLFSCSVPFDRSFNLEKGTHKNEKLKLAHFILQPLMLRRIKKDVVQTLPPKTETNVYVPLSPYQTFWYKSLLARDAGVLEKVTEKASGDDDVEIPVDGSTKKRKAPEIGALMSLFTQLRKVCNHPYLFPNAEVGEDDLLPESEEDKLGEHHDMEVMQAHHLIKTSGKLKVLDKLLVKLKQEGHRVLIFSLFTSMLDILEDYCRLRGWEYCRLDGGTNRVRRVIEVKRFNAKESPVFVFLISTRAGGLGINLHTADTVIHYDSDFNPQVDLQAQDRAHRIGQTKHVHVYRLVTEGTVEERVVMRAQKKLFLDKMVTGMVEKQNENDSMSTNEVLSMLVFGADQIFRANDESGEIDIDKLLERSAKLTNEAKTKLQRKVERQKGDGTEEQKEDGTEKLIENSSKTESAKQSAKDFNFKKAMREIREFQGIKYTHKNRSMRGMATEWDKIRRQLDNTGLDEELPEKLEDTEEVKEAPGTGRKSRRLAKQKQKEKQKEIEEQRLLLLEAERRAAREKRRAKRKGTTKSRSSKRGRYHARNTLGTLSEWKAAMDRLPPPRIMGHMVSWQSKTNSVTNAWVSDGDDMDSGPVARRRPEKQFAQDNLLPGVHSKETLVSWIINQKLWWKELRDTRKRIAFCEKTVLKRRSEKLGLTPEMRKRVDFNVVTWKFGKSRVLEHDFFKIPSEISESRLDREENDQQHYDSSEDISDSPEDISSDGGTGTRTRRRSRKSTQLYSPESDEPKKSAPKSSTKKRKWEHNEWCHLCKVDGDLIKCNWCPRAYHMDCLGRDEKPKGYFSCPQHSCSVCNRKATEAGGLLFRCVVCPCAYCEDHVPSEHNSGRTDLPNGCPELEEVGYVQPASAYYVCCSYSCDKYYKAFKNGFVDYKEENRPDGKEHVMVKGVETLIDKHRCACTSGWGEVEKLHCVCQTPYDEDKFYIGCDDCRKWFHGDCVGIKDGDIEEDAPWSCPLCVMKREYSRRGEANFDISRHMLDESDEDFELSSSASSDVMAPTEDLKDVVDMSVGSKFIEEMTLNERLDHEEKMRKQKGRKSADEISDLANIVKDWNVDKVCQLLKAMNMHAYIPIFQNKQITGLKFLMLDPSKMVELGVHKVHAIQLYNRVVKTTLHGTSKPKKGKGRQKKSKKQSEKKKKSPPSRADPYGMQYRAPPIVRVDPRRNIWPNISVIPSVNSEVASATSSKTNALQKPVMICYQAGVPLPMYVPKAADCLFHCTPPGCPLPRIMDFDDS